VPLSHQNRESWYGRKGKNARANEWIIVGVEPITNIDTDTRAWFSRFIHNSMDAQLSGRFRRSWYFERQTNPVYGLINEKKIGPDYSTISSDNEEVFYDRDRSKVYIKCSVNPNIIKTCEQEFIIPKLEILAKIHYGKDNLKDWNLIQDEITRIVLSFENKKPF
jgi:hypothetical protein